MNQRILATIVNHAAIDISAPADTVWNVILEEIAEGKGLRAVATVVPFKDATAPLGGLRVEFDEQDSAPDKRVVRFTERDEAARRLSVCAEFLSVPGGMRVYATYQAREAPEGACFTLDCHTSLEVEAPSDKDVVAAITKEKSAWDDVLASKLQAVKERLEGASRGR